MLLRNTLGRCTVCGGAAPRGRGSAEHSKAAKGQHSPAQPLEDHTDCYLGVLTMPCSTCSRQHLRHFNVCTCSCLQLQYLLVCCCNWLLLQHCMPAPTWLCHVELLCMLPCMFPCACVLLLCGHQRRQRQPALKTRENAQHSIPYVFKAHDAPVGYQSQRLLCHNLLKAQESR
jgi:hypothetical protein